MGVQIDRHRGWRSWSLAAVGIVVVVVGLVTAAPAAAAVGAVSGIALVTTSDGTAPFDADDTPGNDSGGNNGIVRTSDFVTYQWQYSVATAGDLTFVQALPASMVWDTSSTVSCVEGTAAISADRHTLTCTIASAAAGAGAYAVRAKVLGAANGSVLSTSVTSGAVTSNAVSVTASAETRANVTVYPVTAAASPGTGANAGVPGFRAVLGADLFMPIDPAKGVRGLQSLESPITYQVVLPAAPAGLELFSCAATQASANGPGPSGGGANAVLNSGAMSCAQPGGPGTPVTVTVTGADSTVDSFPSQNLGGGALTPGRAYFAVGNIAVWAPEASFPIGGLTAWTQQLTGFDPNGLDGSSNYGTGFAPGQDPGAACITTPVANCASYSVNRIQIASVTGAVVVPGTYAPGQAATTTPLPGSGGSTAGDAPLYPGQRYNVGSIAITGGGNSPLADFSQCTVWDPTLQQIEPGRVAFSELNAVVQPSADYVVEYGNAVLTDDNARRAATGTCGTAGDGATGWFGSVAAAGGAAAVSEVRLRWINPVNASTNARLWVPMVRSTSSVAAGTPIPMFTSRSGDGLPVVASPYIPATNSGGGGTRGLAAEVQVRNTVAWDAASGTPGETHTITVAPTVTNPYDPGGPAVAAQVHVQVSLPNPCVAYQQGSASVTPIAVTPPDLGPDGIACTADDGAGAVLLFNVGDLAAGTAIAPLAFTAILDPTTPVPATQVVTSIISSPSDNVRVADRTATASLLVNAGAAQFDVTKTSSAAVAAPGIPFTYTIGWSNRLPVTAGTASLVDVLPFSGDARGTTGLGSLDLVSVTPREASTTVQYTTDPAAAVEAAITADPSGNTGIAWTASPPASGVTALRFLTDELLPGSAGGVDVQVVPGGLSRTGQIVNDLSGTASAIPQPLRGAARVTLPSEAAEISGNVYHDLDFSFSQSPDDVGLSGVEVALTGYSFGPNGLNDGGGGDDIPVSIVATTDANGDFVFPGVAPGVYTLTATPPAGMVAAETPAMPVTVQPSATVSGILFGFQDAVTPPIANPDSAQTAIGTSVTIPVLDNDIFPPDARVSVTAVSPASDPGNVTITADGQAVVFAPASGTIGNVTFTYTITDKQRHTATATVTVTVIAPPVITTNPADQTVLEGTAATFTAAATSLVPQTVQWQVSTNGGLTFTDVSGATTDTLTVPSTTFAQSGNRYRAVFTNSGGDSTTTAAALAVELAPPVVTINPADQTVFEGATATFTAAATSSVPLTVHWQVSTNGGATFTDVPGATSNTVKVPSATLAESGDQYRAVFTNVTTVPFANASGSTTTTAATLTVTPHALVVTTNPVDQTVIEGATATFTAAATSSVPATVQWQVSTDGGTTWTDIAAATSPTLTVAAATLGNTGNQYRAVFTNPADTATTTAATLTVTSPAAVPLPPSGEPNSSNGGLPGTGSTYLSNGITALSFLLLLAGSTLLFIGARRKRRD